MEFWWTYLLLTARQFWLACFVIERNLYIARENKIEVTQGKKFIGKYQVDLEHLQIYNG